MLTPHPPVWPVLLSGAIFLYLWWLAAFISTSALSGSGCIRNSLSNKRLMHWSGYESRDDGKTIAPAPGSDRKWEGTRAPSPSRQPKPLEPLPIGQRTACHGCMSLVPSNAIEAAASSVFNAWVAKRKRNSTLTLLGKSEAKLPLVSKRRPTGNIP